MKDCRGRFCYSNSCRSIDNISALHLTGISLSVKRSRGGYTETLEAVSELTLKLNTQSAIF